MALASSDWKSPALLAGPPVREARRSGKGTPRMGEIGEDMRIP
jgi:hypothetical protein